MSACLSLYVVLLFISSPSLGVLSLSLDGDWGSVVSWGWLAEFLALFSISEVDHGLLLGFMPSLLDMITLHFCGLSTGSEGLVMVGEALGVRIC